MLFRSNLILKKQAVDLAESALNAAKAKPKRSCSSNASASEREEVASYNAKIDEEIRKCQEVYDKLLDEFNKITHKRQMLSLANAFNFEELKDFDRRIKDATGIQNDVVYDCELKIDGLALSLEYVGGKLNYGATRGDGLVGEDVTHNVLTIKSIPLNVNENRTFEVRGECYMSRKTFDKLNKEREENVKGKFALSEKYGTMLEAIFL